MRVPRFRRVPRVFVLASALAAVALAAPARAGRSAEAPPALSPHAGPSPGWAAWWDAPPRLGVRVQPMTPELRDYFGGPAERGVLVVKVVPESPAAEAGLAVGDVLLSVDGEALEAPHDLRWRTATAPPLARIDLEVLREGEVTRETIRLRGEPNPILSGRSWHELRDALPPGFHEGGAALRRHLSEIERRLRTLEQQLLEDDR